MPENCPQTIPDVSESGNVKERERGGGGGGGEEEEEEGRGGRVGEIGEGGGNVCVGLSPMGVSTQHNVHVGT